MKHWFSALALWVMAFAAMPAAARSTQTGFLDRAIILHGVEYRYQLYVPRAFDPTRRWPVILALHGGGTLGTNGIQPTSGGLAEAIRQFPDRYPAIVVFPHAHDDGFPVWQGPNGEAALIELDRAVREFSGDQNRVYLTGLSAGGNGAWYLAWRNPTRFAVALMVCSWVRAFHGPTNGKDYPAIAPAAEGDVYAAVARRLTPMPVWLVHGDADPIIDVGESRHLYAAFKSAGADVRLTELPGVGHSAWDAAYRSAEIAAWLFAQRRHQSVSPIMKPPGAGGI